MRVGEFIFVSLYFFDILHIRHSSAYFILEYRVDELYLQNLFQLSIFNDYWRYTEKKYPHISGASIIEKWS